MFFSSIYDSLSSNFPDYVFKFLNPIVKPFQNIYLTKSYNAIMEVNNIYTTKPWSALITHANFDLWTQNVYTESSALRRWFIPRDWIVERRETQFISHIFFFLMKHTICLRENHYLLATTLCCWSHRSSGLSFSCTLHVW